MLSSIGYCTLIAHDGEAALSEVERSLPEVVIVDLELPAIDGLEVARRLREGYGKQMRLIANTAWPDNAETHSKTAERWLRRCAHQADLDLSDYQGRSAQRKTTCLVTAVRPQPLGCVAAAASLGLTEA